jgi:T5orf172 domain-containing protein
MADETVNKPVIQPDEKPPSPIKSTDPFELVRHGNANSKRSYNLNYFYGMATIRRVAGDFIEDTNEIRRVAESLNMLADILDEQRKKVAIYSQAEYRSSVTKAVAIAIAQTCSWDFKPSQVDNVWHKDAPVTTLPQKFSRVVYFARHADFPGCVKIGSTENIWRRTQQLYKEFNLDQSQPIVLSALVRTDRHKELEYWLHEALSEDQVTGEWYASPGVEWFLSKMRTYFSGQP